MFDTSTLDPAGVPDAEAEVFMGRNAEGSGTGKRYIHRRPEYLHRVVDGIEALFRALSEFCRATIQRT